MDMRGFNSFSAALLVSLFIFSAVSCGEPELVDPTPVTPVDPNPPTPTKDTKAPVITIAKSSVNVISGPAIIISGNEMKIGEEAVASWKDDVSSTCKVELTFTPKDGSAKTVNSGDKLSEEGKLQLKVTDEAGNAATAEITLTRSDSEAPVIEVKIAEKNVIAGVTVSVRESQLLFDEDVAANWTDDYTAECKVELTFTPEGASPKEILSGDQLSEAGILSIKVTDEFNNRATAEITLTAVAVTGLENLQNLSLQVDTPVNLLKGLTIAEGLTLQKVEIEQDGVRTEIDDPKTYTPELPGAIDIILTLVKPDESAFEVWVGNLSVKALIYNSPSISNLKPVNILPIIGQIEVGDKKAYEHIEHLRVAEATRIIDMMWEYGTGKHSPEEYQELMMRLNTGMLRETPIGWDNFETVGGSWNDGSDPMGHAYREYYILNTLIKHANFKVIDNANHRENLYNLCKTDPTKINIMGLSAGADVDKKQYDAWHEEKIKEYDKEKNRIVFCSGSNIRKGDDGILKNKIYQDDYLIDEHGVYCGWSRAHNKTDNTLDRHLFLTISTDKTGDIEQTNEDEESSKFPVGFHNKVLFAGRDFPSRYGPDKKIRADNGKYPTSFTNFFNVALTDLCFQMHADVKDVDELLDMIRSTALTDYIRFDLNGDGDTKDEIDGQPESQPLQLINPAGVFKKYCVTADIPSSIGAEETINLTKEWYKGLIFAIPGAEVIIDGQWIAYDAKNKDLILAQNPMDLEWRLNGALLRKYGYTSGQTLQGQILTVDDQWNGLRLEKDFAVQVK